MLVWILSLGPFGDILNLTKTLIGSAVAAAMETWNLWIKILDFGGDSEDLHQASSTLLSDNRSLPCSSFGISYIICLSICEMKMPYQDSSVLF